MARRNQPSQIQGPLNDAVALQYQQWTYPEKIEDLPSWLVSNWQWFDPVHAHRVLWPNRDYVPDLDILVAGCGTNQAAVFAYTNPSARVVAIDVSEPSLSHHHCLKERYGLRNLEISCLPVESAGELGLEFDLIVSTGVLHHLADPDLGLKVLAGCLKHDGVVAIMLYARYGRYGVEMLQSIFRDLELRQDEASLSIVKEAVAQLPVAHPLRSYLALAPDLCFDAGLVDTFLHGRDRSYSVDDCLRLVEASGLVFQDWFLKQLYYPLSPAQGSFYQAIEALPLQRQWSIMERLNTSNACHFFMACRPDRSPQSYQIDFKSSAAMDYVPVFRYRCGVENGMLNRPGQQIQPTTGQLAQLQLIDGRRTIGDIVAMNQALPEPALTYFASLWQSDYLSMRL